MADANSDRNLLFGVLALQDELIDRDQFADVCAAWALRPDRPLADLLIERGWLTPADRDDIERRLDRKIDKHGGDARATLDAAGGTLNADIWGALRAIDRPAVRETVDRQPPAPAPFATRVEEDGPADASLLPIGRRSRYTLARVLAQGGLGRVWVARDVALNRDVALKEIRSDRIEHPEAAIRFLREAQVTGQLEHPNIVPVYELGRRPEDAQPYYTMRLVRGRTLRETIADYHRRREQGMHDPLEFQRLLNALVAVCQAIGYAHARGVLHRDLKPENIVLGGFGEVVVLDWGLAKLIDRRDHDPRAEGGPVPRVELGADASGQRTIGVIGTPAYMAPEQADARNESLDERTDIYGLGAILFEILTGKPPVEAPSVSELLSKLAIGATRRARALVPSVPAPLDAICAKAMAAAPAERYARATDLADELQRWIADEPVRAYREPWTARAVRWGRRHRPAVAAAAALLAASVVGLSVHNVRIARERAVAVGHAREALKQKSRAEVQQRLAEQNFRRARAAVDQMLTEVGAVELADIPQLEPVRERLLAKAQRFYVDFLEEEKGDPALRAEAGQAYRRLGDIEELLGDFPRAEQAYRQSIASLGDDAATRSERARAYHGLGILLKKWNRFREAETALREALRLREQLAAGAPAGAEIDQALAQTRYHLGALLAKLRGRRGEDEAAYRAALALQQKLVADSRDKPERRRELCRYLNNLGILLRDTGRLEEAEAAYREALATASKLGRPPHAQPGDRWQWAQLLNNLGVLMKDTRRPSEAAAAYAEARRLQEELASAYPRIPSYRKGLAATENNRGLLGMSTGDPAGAERALSRALELQQALIAEFPGVPDYRAQHAQSCLNLGIALESRDPARAESLLRTAQKESEDLARAFPGVPEYTSALGIALYCLGDLRARRDDLTEARRLLSQAIYHQRAALESDPRNPNYRRALGLSHRDHAEVLKRQGAHADLAQAARELARLADDDPDGYRYAAYYLAQAASLVADDRALGEARRNELRDAYAREAVGLLRRAFERRLIADPRELDHPNLDPIRSRPDFRKLLEEMKELFQPRLTRARGARAAGRARYNT